MGSDAKTEDAIGSLLDVLDLHAVGAGGARDEVGVVLGHPESSEAWQAISTLVTSMRGGPAVHLHLAGPSGLHPVAPTAFDVTASRKPADYLRLVDELAPQPPQLLRTVLAEVGSPALRAYPMLTGNPDWSLRLEGLEVGRFREGRGWLDVGKPGVA